MEPPTVTAQTKRLRVVRGKPMFYESARAKAAREMIEAALQPYRPGEPMAGPVMLSVVWAFPTRSHREGAWRVTRPDTDNLQKMLKDCMTRAGFWRDDSQVCSEHIMKVWTRKRPGILIEVTEYGDDKAGAGDDYRHLPPDR